MTFADSVQLMGNADFVNRVQAALLVQATEVKGETIRYNADRSFNMVDSKRQGFADQVLQNPSQIAYRAASLVAVDDTVIASYSNGDHSTIDDAEIVAALATLWDDLSGVRSEDVFDPSPDELANNVGFQRRVYQVCAQLANGVIASAPYSGNDPALLAAEKVKRLFAVRFQAGKYLAPPFPLNFAANVVAGSTIAALTDFNDITDAMISARLQELVGMFVKGQTELEALGVDTGLLQ